MENALNRVKALCRNAIWAKGPDAALYQVLFHALKDAIEQNDIPAGSVLPSTRLLAQGLDISRSTVVQVYDLLKIGNLIDAKPGSGYHVKKPALDAPRQAAPAAQPYQYPPLSDTGKSFLGLVPSLEVTTDEEMAFRPGLPPLDIFPVNQWKILNNLYWRHVKNDDLSYISSSGTNQLRETLAAYLNYTRKIKCDPQQIIIVSGSLQSIYTIGNILLNPGDCIAHENPTFPNVISIFNGLRASVHAVPVDDEGLMVSRLSRPDEPSPKMVHIAPSCHYPTGVRMSLVRRLELIQWANEHNSVIIENDYEHEVNNYLDFIPSIYSLDKQQRTFFLGTFNRLLHPSVRVGYMVVPPHYLDAVEALLRYLYRFVPNSKQLVLSQFIEKNYIYNHIQNLLEVAERRREYFRKTFRENFEGDIYLNNSYTRSLHLLAEFHKALPDQKLIAQFRAKDITVHAYSKTFVNDTPSKDGLIIGYSPVNESEMKLKIQQMKKIFLHFQKSYR